MNDYDKPPIGCSPSYIPASIRIQDLADAISRHSPHAEQNTGHIKKWAEEIIFQCNIIEKFYFKETKRSELEVNEEN